MSYKTIAAAAFALVGAVSTAAPAAPGSYEIIASYPSIIDSADGVEALGDGTILLTECSSDAVVRLDSSDGTYLDELSTAGSMIDHLARDLTDGTVWGNTHPMEEMPMSEASVVQFDPATGEILTKFELERPQPGSDVMGFPMGMAWDGATLWTQDVENRVLYQLDMETGEIIHEIPSPVEDGCGLGFDGKCFWIGAFDRYYLIDPATGNVELVVDPPLPANANAIKMFTGFAWDGQYVYLDNECPYDETVYVLDFEFPTEGPCARSVSVEGGECDIWNASVCAEGLVCDRADDEVSGICVTLEEQTPGAGDSGGCGCASVGSAAAAGPGHESLLGLLL